MSTILVIVAMAVAAICVVLVLVVLGVVLKRSGRVTDPPAVTEAAAEPRPGVTEPAAARAALDRATSDLASPDLASSDLASPDLATSDRVGFAGAAARPAESGPVGAAREATVARAEQAVRDAEERRRAVEAEIRQLRADLQTERSDLERRTARLTEREERIDAEARLLAEQTGHLDERRDRLAEQADALEALEQQQQAELERIGGLTPEEARDEVLSLAEVEARRQAAVQAREIEAKARRDADQLAREIIVGAVQRVAAEQTSEASVSTVHLPSDDMKGRIIGREGRNIRAFEQVTGVNVLIDDTPESVLLSCFEPVRRETARLAMEELVADGRIHPARIEEVYERATSRIEATCLRAAEDAATEVGIIDLHPDLMPVIGSLRYRTSYGQNVLRHLVESAHLAGLMAAELGLDVDLCKRAAFLHDIGKALTHEVEGSHAMVGADLARRHGERPDIVHAIEAHHNEIEPQTVEAILTQAADAISGSRPGARRESLESYVKRLQHLEKIAAAHAGVDKVFAMQAGREVRVMVTPEQVDDIGAQVMARDIAKQIEEKLTYPGQIKITVVRESRASETAR